MKNEESACDAMYEFHKNIQNVSCSSYSGVEDFELVISMWKINPALDGFLALCVPWCKKLSRLLRDGKLIIRPRFVI